MTKRYHLAQNVKSLSETLGPPHLGIVARERGKAPEKPAANGGGEEQATTKVAGLDAIRFVLAAWVMIGHVGQLPYAETIPREPLIWLLVRGVYNNLINGPAAVIVFFVISGFCIHFPYRNDTRVDLLPYFARRHIRILLPVLAAVILAKAQGVRLEYFAKWILWSLVCEEIYYTIYPILLRLRHRFGWPKMIAGAFALALLVAATKPGAGNYPSYGWQLNWLLGLPCWLLGCHLAQSWETTKRLPRPERAFAPSRVWFWRVVALLASTLCSMLRFHSPLTYPWTLNFFALLTYSWLGSEMLFALRRRPWKIAEWAGSMSYSIYLVHVICLDWLASQTSLSRAVTGEWLALIAATLLMCMVFYYLVERPSHRLARATYAFLVGRRRLSVPSGSEIPVRN